MSALKKAPPSAPVDRYNVKKMLIRATPKKLQSGTCKGLRKHKRALMRAPELALFASRASPLLSQFDERGAEHELLGESDMGQQEALLKPSKQNSRLPTCDAYQEGSGNLMPVQVTATIWPSVVDFIRRSEIFKEYQQAFCGTTGLPLALIDATPRPFAFKGQSTENPFCALMDQTQPGYASSLEMQKVLSSRVREQPVTSKCMAGLSYSAIPVRRGDKILGCLYTGQVFLSEPTQKAFNRTMKTLSEWGMKTNVKRIEAVYYGVRILTPKQYDGMLRLLSVFAKHLGWVSNQIVVEPAKLLCPMIQDAQHYIKEHQQEPLTLAEVAKSVQVSAQYFSSLFHQTTGITFTDYVARLRVERATAMLANSQNRIGEVAFAVGFESLSQFNRVFRRVVGNSPTQSRAIHQQMAIRA